MPDYLKITRLMGVVNSTDQVLLTQLMEAYDVIRGPLAKKVLLKEMWKVVNKTNKAIKIDQMARALKDMRIE